MQPLIRSVLDGYNVCIFAYGQTGSGKTLGYLMPAFMHLRQRRNNSRNGPTVLVLAPTRELATQIQDEAIKFGRSSRISCTVFIITLIHSCASPFGFLLFFG